tara:strand:+ start:183 stop:386 length:204 start_codon:yes stop_codon:yes gene_type:complete
MLKTKPVGTQTQRTTKNRITGKVGKLKELELTREESLHLRAFKSKVITWESAVFCCPRLRHVYWKEK